MCGARKCSLHRLAISMLTFCAIVLESDAYFRNGCSIVCLIVTAVNEIKLRFIRGFNALLKVL
uniref:Secreted protein n=1 Tax=Ascaris lumbricoides TaxID=6252 RepID=A0A0M3IAH3_ASCLU